MELNDFYEKGQTKEITELSYTHYEERRQLKLVMINEIYQKDKQMNKKKHAAQTIKVNKASFICKINSTCLNHVYVIIIWYNFSLFSE